MSEYQWKVGDKIQINHTGLYRYTRVGAIGIILRILKSNLALIRFTKKENTHIPELIHVINTNTLERREIDYNINLSHCSPFNNHVDDFSQILAKKIKTLDTKWATTQVKKGNKYALLLLQ